MTTTSLAFPLPLDDQQRVEALHSYCVLDTPPEPAFDRITHILQHVMGVATVLVSLVDSDRQWFKSRIGMSATETPRSQSFCAHAVFSKSPLLVTDATVDPRFKDNPLVTCEGGIRFYVGVPLIDARGFALGTLCAIDDKLRSPPTAAEMDVMSKLADEVVAALELRRFAQIQAAEAQKARMMSELAAKSIAAADLKNALSSMLGSLCAYTGGSVAHAYWRTHEGAREFQSLGVWHDDLQAPLSDDFRELSASFDLSALDEASATFLASGSAVLTGGVDAEQSARASHALAASLGCGLMVPIMAAGRIQGIVECHGARQLPSERHLLEVADYMSLQLSRLAEREHADAAKNDFIARICEELKQPLQAISATFELLDSGHGGELPPKASTMLATSQRNGLRLLNMVSDILDVARLESGAMAFNCKAQAISPLVERAMSNLATAARRAKVSLEFDGSDPSLTASVDPVRFTQAITNLLSNAMRSSPSGETVTLRVLRHGPYVRVEVQDRGAGIPAELQPRIFEKFTSKPQQPQPHATDTGLGLVVTKNVVEAMDGSVSLESQGGQGSVFRIDLPLVVG